MAFQAPTAAPRQIIRNATHESTSTTAQRPHLEESQEWILFSPSQVGSSTDRSSRTVGLSRTSELESLETAGRSRLDSEVLDEITEDGELDTLDEGLHAFQEPLYPITSQQSQGVQLPTHDGLGGFPASSPPVLEQLWQHEHFNPKRKHDGHHRRPSSVQRRLDTIEELEAQANEEKRIRIEKWRLDQSQAMIEEVERETRRHLQRQRMQQGLSTDDILGSTPRQSDYLNPPSEDESEPFWRRLTRKFIRDIIGIDEPLLSVILGESLPEEALSLEQKPPLSTIPETTSTTDDPTLDDTWRTNLLHRIARELGVCVHAISPHPGAFTTYTPQTHDYAGMPVTIPATQPQQSTTSTTPLTQSTVPHAQLLSSALTPNFPPTIHNPHHAATWGFDDTAPGGTSTSSSHLAETLNLQREREYWERELDVRRVFRFLKERIVGTSSAPAHASSSAATGYGSSPEEMGQRSAVIRQHHPLVARAHARPTAAGLRRRESGQAAAGTAALGAAGLARVSREAAVARRPGSSCASESVRSRGSSRGTGRRSSGAGSRNYWDLGGSLGSGSLVASGGVWGEV